MKENLGRGNRFDFGARRSSRAKAPFSAYAMTTKGFTVFKWQTRQPSRVSDVTDRSRHWNAPANAPDSATSGLRWPFQTLLEPPSPPPRHVRALPSAARRGLRKAGNCIWERGLSAALVPLQSPDFDEQNGPDDAQNRRINRSNGTDLVHTALATN